MKKDEQEKLRTVSIINENIKQVFIDNINGKKSSLSDLENADIKALIDSISYLDIKNLIIENILNFYRKNINDNIGNVKGINSENFIVKIKEFLENSEDLLILRINYWRK